MAVNEQNYVDEAEKVIQKLKDYKDNRGRIVPMVTTSKLRSLLSMSIDIYNQAVNQNTDRLDADIASRIEYLRVRFLYEAGREESVKKLVEEAGIIGMLKNVKGSRDRYLLFQRYMEALVAFHKYYGGRDN